MAYYSAGLRVFDIRNLFCGMLQEVRASLAGPYTVIAAHFTETTYVDQFEDRYYRVVAVNAAGGRRSRVVSSGGTVFSISKAAKRRRYIVAYTDNVL